MGILGTRDGLQLRPILARALNRNQLLILAETCGNRRKAITPLLRELGAKSSTPISTLKLNARTLRDLGLVSFGNSCPAVATPLGRKVVMMFGCRAKFTIDR
jgi:hypothetical protein